MTHKHHVVSATYRQCSKALWKGTKIHVNISDVPFEKHGADFSMGDFFDELDEHGV